MLVLARKVTDASPSVLYYWQRTHREGSDSCGGGNGAGSPEQLAGCREPNRQRRIWTCRQVNSWNPLHGRPISMHVPVRFNWKFLWIELWCSSTIKIASWPDEGYVAGFSFNTEVYM